ncbi:MAG: secretin and TonB N-terminal domain-containing protein [Candidatus Omnitrophota bacterium]
MKKTCQGFLSSVILGVFAVFIFVNFSFAQDSGNNTSQEGVAIPPAENQPAGLVRGDFSVMDNVTLDFKDADIRNVLKIIAQKSGINIVATPDVVGTVTIKLSDVPWDRAMEVILKSNGFGYQRQGNVILVTKIENMSKIQSEEPLKTEIIDLKFLDAQDAVRILIPMLSNRGKMSILYSKGQKGWKFGTFRIGQTTVDSAMLQKEADAKRLEIVSVEKNAAGQIVSTKMENEPSIKSKTIIVTDTDSVIDRIKTDIIPQIDRRPKQVLVEARIMEVNIDKLRDIGFDYGTGLTGADTLDANSLNTLTKSGNTVKTQAGASLLNSQLTPSNFGAKNSASGIEPFNAGLELLLKKVTGKQFEVMIHALEEDVHVNTLSSPRIVTLDNQEASILVGYHMPILASTLSKDGDTGEVVINQSLGYYQEIGIRLNVVPQVSEEGYINMIIHPSITSSTTNVTANSVIGNTTISTDYPIIDVREAQTQILMKDGETVVIGGLLKDVQTKGVTGVPFLSKIPFLGALFRRETIDNSKVDLLIFITAHVVTDEEFSPEEITKIENRLKQMTDKPAKQGKAKK